MQNLSSEQQLNILAEFLSQEIERLRKMPEEEARKEAFKNLHSAGIIDENGNYTESYAPLED